ncbi:hypothetical protein [Kineosporia babensis]|uniref:Lipoprotein n=1 Tax=Kineosporia babensis TaxID=499548 RepID=A0A9X1NBY8_9ACTN|nr:hypothetical protein [Kineosporia babensis]MCD5311318.1 hypothetical protein [Kineosporia babensis]
MMKRTGLTLFAGFGLLATTVVAGCGSEAAPATTGSGGPKSALLEAFDSMSQSQGVGLEVKLDSSRADLEKVNAAQPKAEQMNQADLDLAVAALDGRILSSFSAADGETLAEGPSSYQVSVQLKEASLVDLVGVDDDFYLKLDADWIAQQFDSSTDDLRGAFEGADPLLADPANALLEHQWISIDLAEAEKALQTNDLDELLGSEPDLERGYALMQSLQASFEQETEVTAIDGGYRVSAPAKQIAQAVQDDLVALAGDGESDAIKQEIEALPDRDVTVDVFLQDGKLSGVNLDLVQFLDQPVEGANLALDVKIDQQANTVQAPKDAVAVDVAGILAEMG